MKISKSKQELARIISENGGWRDKAESAAQCRGGEISFWHDTATKQPGTEWRGSYLGKKHDIEFTGVKLPNWHQTILSRDEYFHLYPSQDVDGCIKRDENGIISIEYSKDKQDVVAPSEQVWANPPTIEQLAADYRNAKDYAYRKQQEADAAKADADEKLRVLELAGEAIGLIVSPITAKQDAELAITDWRDLQVGDEVEYLDGGMKNKIGMVGTIDKFDHNSCTDRFFRIKDGYNFGWPTKWRFIRRP